MAFKSLRAQFSQTLEDDGETPMFVIERNDDFRIRRAQYSVKMSFYNRKIYFHIQNNVKGTSTSLPEEVMNALLEIGEEMAAAKELLRNLQPPSPPMRKEKELEEQFELAWKIFHRIDKKLDDICLDMRQIGILKCYINDVLKTKERENR